MEMMQMNGPKQVRFIYQVLKEGAGNQYKDVEILEYANSLHKLFNKEFEEGYDYRPSFDEQKTKDAFSLISSENGELMYEERELLNSVYEFESDDFITSKTWNKKYFGGSDECQ